MERIKRRKAQGLQDRYLYDYTFSNDNGQNPLMDKAHAYVETVSYTHLDVYKRQSMARTLAPVPFSAAPFRFTKKI